MSFRQDYKPRNSGMAADFGIKSVYFGVIIKNEKALALER